MLKALARGTRKNLRPERLLHTAARLPSGYPYPIPGTRRHPTAAGLLSSRSVGTLGSTPIAPRQATVAGTPSARKNWYFPGDQQERYASLLSGRGGLPDKEDLPDITYPGCEHKEDLKNADRKGAALVFSNDRFGGNTRANDGTLNPDRDVRFDNIIKELQRGIYVELIKTRQGDKEWNIGFDESTKRAELRNVGSGTGVGGDSYKADGFIIIDTFMIIFDSKKLSATIKKDGTISVAWSSGANGETLYDNITQLMIDLIIKYGYSIEYIYKNLFFSKFEDIYSVRKISETDINILNPILSTNNILQSAKVTAYNFNIITRANIRSIKNTPLNKRLDLPNGYGYISSQTNNVKAKLNTKAICTDKFAVVEAIVYFLETNISLAQRNAIQSKYPDSRIYIEEIEIPDPETKKLVLRFKVVISRKVYKPMIPEAYRVENNSLNPVNLNSSSPENQDVVPPINYYNDPNVIAEEVKAAARLRNQPSPQMKGGYKRSRTTRRKPRRARV